MPQRSTLGENTRTILLYTPSFDSIDWHLKTLGQAPFEHCPVSDCYITTDKRFFGEKPDTLRHFDAITFHLSMMAEPTFSLDELKRIRSPKQRFILAEDEPPLYMVWQDLSKFNHFFNWTMYYAKNSDIRFLHAGNFIPKVNSSSNALQHVYFPLMKSQVIQMLYCVSKVTS